MGIPRGSLRYAVKRKSDAGYGYDTASLESTQRLAIAKARELIKKGYEDVYVFDRRKRVTVWP